MTPAAHREVAAHLQSAHGVSSDGRAGSWAGPDERARRPIEIPLQANQRWSLDFVSDQMTDGRRFRILTVVDDCTRECLAPGRLGI